MVSYRMVPCLSELYIWGTGLILTCSLLRLLAGAMYADLQIHLNFSYTFEYNKTFGTAGDLRKSDTSMMYVRFIVSNNVNHDVAILAKFIYWETRRRRIRIANTPPRISVRVRVIRPKKPQRMSFRSWSIGVFFLTER